jgi:hypothetical protein
MKLHRFALVVLLALGAISCRVVPETPPTYSEEIVLRVWDALDAHYGSEAFFECEHLPVVGGKIRIIRPYLISNITVLSYLPWTDRMKFFHPVRSSPGPDKFLVEGTTLHFDPRHEGENLFVAWIPDLSETELRERKQNDGFLE